MNKFLIALLFATPFLVTPLAARGVRAHVGVGAMPYPRYEREVVYEPVEVEELHVVPGECPCCHPPRYVRQVYTEVRPVVVRRSAPRVQPFFFGGLSFRVR